jgi:hypothetical protein
MMTLSRKINRKRIGSYRVCFRGGQAHKGQEKHPRLNWQQVRWNRFERSTPEYVSVLITWSTGYSRIHGHLFQQSRAAQSRSLLPAISRHGHSWHQAPVGPVAIDGVWIGYWVYWPLIHTTRNYRQLQRYRWSTHFTVHRYKRTRVLSLH